MTKLFITLHVSIIHWQGFGGLPGLPGLPGLKGMSGEAGRDGRATEPGKSSCFESKIETMIDFCVGAKGEPGDTGASGLPGLAGMMGDAGKYHWVM